MHSTACVPPDKLRVHTDQCSEISLEDKCLNPFAIQMHKLLSWVCSNLVKVEDHS